MQHKGMRLYDALEWMPSYNISPKSVVIQNKKKGSILGFLIIIIIIRELFCGCS